MGNVLLHRIYTLNLYFLSCLLNVHLRNQNKSLFLLDVDGFQACTEGSMLVLFLVVQSQLEKEESERGEKTRSIFKMHVIR